MNTRLTERDRERIALAARIIEEQGYEFFLRWMAYNKARAAERKSKRRHF